MNETATPQDQNLFSGKKPSISELSKKLVSFDDAPVETADGVPTSKYLTQIVQKYGSGAQQQPAGTPAAAPTAQPAAAIPATQPEAPITQPDTPAAAPAAPTAPVAQPTATATNDTYKAVSSIQDPDIQARLAMVKENSSPEEFQRYIDEMGKHDPQKIVDQLKGLPVDHRADFNRIKKDKTDNASTYNKILSMTDDADLLARLDTVRKNTTTEEFQRYVDAMNGTSPDAVIKQLKGLDVSSSADYAQNYANRKVSNSVPGQAVKLAGEAASSFSNFLNKASGEVRKGLGIPSLIIPEMEQSKEDSFGASVGKTSVNLVGGLINGLNPLGTPGNLVPNIQAISDIRTMKDYLAGNENATTGLTKAAATALPEIKLAGEMIGKIPGAKTAFSTVGDFVNTFKVPPAVRQVLQKNEYANPLLGEVQKAMETGLSKKSAGDFEQFMNEKATELVKPEFDKLKGLGKDKPLLTHSELTEIINKTLEKETGANMKAQEFSNSVLDGLVKEGTSKAAGKTIESARSGITQETLDLLNDQIPKIKETLKGDGAMNGKELLDVASTIRERSVFNELRDSNTHTVGKTIIGKIQQELVSTMKKKFPEMTKAWDKFESVKQAQEAIQGPAQAAYNKVFSTRSPSLQFNIGDIPSKILEKGIGGGNSFKNQLSAAGISKFQTAAKVAKQASNTAMPGVVSNANQTQQSGPGATQQPGKKMSKAEAQAYMKSLGL